MFTKDTVIILGAGASCHYGYPTGEELVKLIAAKAASIRSQYYSPAWEGRIPSQFQQTYPRNFRSAADFTKLIEDLKSIESKINQSNPLVIDYFLGHNSDIAKVGKLLTAMVLLERESVKPILPPTDMHNHQVDDWIRFVTHQLTIGCREPKELLSNKITFVTFNYDLSLERRLHLALANYRWFFDGGFTSAFFDNGRVCHVYGQLRSFYPNSPTTSPVTHPGLAFPLAYEIDRACEEAKGLRTIAPEEKVASPEIRNVIENASHLYILGYGFDPHNNRLLGLGDRSETKKMRQKVCFTNFGNHNKINKIVAKTFNVSASAISGENYVAENVAQARHQRYTCEKSIKDVYRALAEDFDWPD